MHLSPRSDSGEYIKVASAPSVPKSCGNNEMGTRRDDCRQMVQNVIMIDWLALAALEMIRGSTAPTHPEADASCGRKAHRGNVLAPLRSSF